jgi:hypothetical protein
VASSSIFSSVSVTMKLRPFLCLLVFFQFSAFRYPRITSGQVKVKVTLRPTSSRSVSPGFKAHVGLTTGYLFLLTFTSIVLSIAGAPSDERSGLGEARHAAMCVSLGSVPRKCFLCGLFPGYITRTPADSELR